MPTDVLGHPVKHTSNGLDLLISNATVVDGSGRPGFAGVVGIAGEHIACVLPEEAPRPVADREYEAAGHVVCPGFIDVHTHADVSPFLDAAMESQIRQGVTSVVVGNCGYSLWPGAGRTYVARAIAGIDDDGLLPSWESFGALLDAIDKARPACNVGSLVGHGSLRLQVMGEARRAASRSEARTMRSLAAEALGEGALGLSTGLIYVPGMYSELDELVELAGALRPFDAPYVSHMRGEGRELISALTEAQNIGRRSGVPVHVSHLKLMGSCVWGQVERLLEHIDGSEVSADQYPYTAWLGSLASLLPPWAPVCKLPAIMANRRARAKLKQVVECGEPGWESSVDGVGWRRIVIADASSHDLGGVDLETIAADRHEEPLDTLAWLLSNDPEISVIGQAMQEDDVRRILAEPSILVASDGLPASAAAHPRSVGTFARVLGRYVREERVLSLETAVRKMTSLPAERFGLAGRGVLAQGATADVVVFDPARVAEAATFENPRRFADGVELVLVNGVRSWDGSLLGRGGRALRQGGI